MSCKYSVFLPGLYFSCRKGAGTVQCPWVSAGYLGCSCCLALLVFRHFRLVQILTQQWIFGVVHINPAFVPRSKQRCEGDVGRNQEKIQQQLGFSGASAQQNSAKIKQILWDLSTGLQILQGTGRGGKSPPLNSECNNSVKKQINNKLPIKQTNPANQEQILLLHKALM